MKKVVLFFATMSFVLTFACVSCSNPAGGDGSNPVATAPGSGGTGGTTGGGQTGGVTVGGDGTITISSKSLIYIGEGSETIDSKTYVVKKYAELIIDDNPYFYIYYKLYYLNGKLRRVYTFSHGLGSDLDYKYTEFVEHTCGNNGGIPIVYSYYENGKIESYIWGSCTDGTIHRFKNYYDINGKKIKYNTYVDNVLQQEYEYYSNGKYKVVKNYETSAQPSYLSYKTTYYENGQVEYNVYYSAEGSETSKYYYSYYDSGNKKIYESYSNGKLSFFYNYFDNNSKLTKLYAIYNSDETINYFEYYYSSGFLQYYYYAGNLYTYANNKTKTSSTNSSVYSNKESYTDSQAKTKLQSLKY